MGIGLHQVVAELFGYHLVRKDKLVEIKHAPGEHLRLLLENLGINHVLDVGANTGQYVQELRDIGYSGRITSFEPVQSCYDELMKKSSRDDLWDIRHHALGAKQEQLEINVSEATAFSSFLPANDYANKRYKRIQPTHTENVQVERLDAIFNEITQPDERVYLKLDTQGYDLQAFAGCQNCMDRILGMQSEVSVTAIYENMPNYLESLKVYQDAGFQLTGLYPIAWDEPTLRVIEFDCYMRKM
jgi:FkbM family methyltransferase